MKNLIISVLLLLAVNPKIGSLAFPIRLKSSTQDEGRSDKDVVISSKAYKLLDINDTLVYGSETQLLNKTHRLIERSLVGNTVEPDSVVDDSPTFPTWLYVAILGVCITITGFSFVVVSVVDCSKDVKTLPAARKNTSRWLCDFSCLKGTLFSCRSSDKLNDTVEHKQLESLLNISEQKNSFEFFPVLFEKVYDLAYTSPPSEATEEAIECSALNGIVRSDSGVSDLNIVSDDDTTETIELINENNLKWTEMYGKFNNEGGILTSEKSDVKLILPEGALPSEEMTEIYVKVYVEVSKFPCGGGDGDSFFVTPIVECGPPGLRFLKPVQIVLPHRVRMGGPSKKTVLKIDSNLFSAVYSNDVIGNSTKLQEISFTPVPHVSESCPQSSLTFDVDERFVNINTTHFTLFGCIGPRRKHQLKLNTYAYYNYMVDDARNRLIVQYRLYISSNDRDTRTHIEDSERSFKGRICTPIKPFNLLDKHNVTVDFFLESAENWKVAITPELIPWNEFYEDSSSCFQVTMSWSMSDDGVIASNCLIGKFRLHQQSTEKKKKKTEHTYFQELELTGINLRNCLNKVKLTRKQIFNSIKDISEDKIPSMTDEFLSLLSQHLLPKQLRQLGRSLGLNEVTIQQIEHDNDKHGSKEIAFQILKTWKKGEGYEASFEVLEKALEDSECFEIAEKLYTI
ncbi:uncharacterized protein LOC144448287 [Glandiceps talaboti]